MSLPFTDPLALTTYILSPEQQRPLVALAVLSLSFRVVGDCASFNAAPNDLVKIITANVNVMWVNT